MNEEVVKYYDTIAESYDDSRFNNSYGQFIDAEERKILDMLIDRSKKEKRLELACGTGRLTNYATHGLDASSEMMSYAKKRHQNVSFTLASATETGFADEEFDVVYSFHLLMHLDDDIIKNIFSEAWRILKPGGRLIFDIPSKDRRNLLHKKRSSWHGSTAFTSAEIEDMTNGLFEIRKRFGIMLFPVHILPAWMRKSLIKTDYFLAGMDFLKRYCSYNVYELVKRDE